MPGRVPATAIPGEPVLRSVTSTWHLLPQDATAIERMAIALGTSPIVAQLLLNRQQCDADAASAFLKAPLTGLHEPERLPGMPEAVERIHAAVAQKKRIVVYGDYDVDGVSGTAILLTTLRQLGADVDFHVPHRLEDGYGLSHEALRKIAEGGVSVVVTVDCGIASCAEADEARRPGPGVIGTDRPAGAPGDGEPPCQAGADGDRHRFRHRPAPERRRPPGQRPVGGRAADDAVAAAGAGPGPLAGAAEHPAANGRAAHLHRSPRN